MKSHPITKDEFEILHNMELLDLPTQLPLGPVAGQALADLLTQLLWDINRMTPWSDRRRDESDEAMKLLLKK